MRGLVGSTALRPGEQPRYTCLPTLRHRGRPQLGSHCLREPHFSTHGCPLQPPHPGQACVLGLTPSLCLLTSGLSSFILGTGEASELSCPVSKSEHSAARATEAPTVSGALTAYPPPSPGLAAPAGPVKPERCGWWNPGRGPAQPLTLRTANRFHR